MNLLKNRQISFVRFFYQVHSVPALEALSQFGGGLLHIITKAKKNATAYEHPVRKHKRGAPPKKGDKIKLLDLFSTKADSFIR